MASPWRDLIEGLAAAGVFLLPPLIPILFMLLLGAALLTLTAVTCYERRVRREKSRVMNCGQIELQHRVVFCCALLRDCWCAVSVGLFELDMILLFFELDVLVPALSPLNSIS